MTRRILIVAAHPDDEILGMGGTIARHVAEGDHVAVTFLGDGVGSRGQGDDQAVARRQQAARAAANVLGFEVLGFGSYPDNGFDIVPLLDLVRHVESIKHAFQPDWVYTHHGGDLNIDHRMTYQAVLTSFRPQPHERYEEIRCFEVNSSTEWADPRVFPPFLPDTYVDISAVLDQLLEAYGCYQDEIRPAPHARSMEALRVSSRNRGYQVGLEAAEAFMTARRILR